MYLKTHPLRFSTCHVLKLALIVLIAASMVFTDVREAQACVCSRSAPPKDLDYFAMVFAGRVVDKRTFFNPNASIFSHIGKARHSAETVHTFLVSKIWKGPLYEFVYVREERTQTSCPDRSFALGEEYLIYAEPPKLTVSYCSASIPLASAQKNLALLGPGEPPEAGTVAPRPESLTHWYSQKEKSSAFRQPLSRLDPSRDPRTSESMRGESDLGAPGWLLPAVAGASGVLVGALGTTLRVRRRGGGT